MKAKLVATVFVTWLLAGNAHAELFLVTTSEGPGFKSPGEAAEVLEKGILPTFEALMQLKKKKKIVAGGLPIAGRKLVLLVEAESHDAVDRMLRDLPAWGVFSWKVTALQSLQGRMQMEQEILRALKESM